MKHMPNLISQDDIKALVTNTPRPRDGGKQNFVIFDGDPQCVDGVKYDFRIGPRFLKPSMDRPIEFKELGIADRSRLARIEPGEVVFVLTEESISLPADMIVMLSPKRSIAHDGIEVLGGFCVDPLYTGRLLIGLYNFSSSSFALEQHRKIIAGLFYRLIDAEQANFSPPRVSVEDFPEPLVRMISNFQPLNIIDVNTKISELKSELNTLTQHITSSREWQTKFEDNLDKIQKETGKVAELLRDEIVARKERDTKAEGDIKDQNKKIEELKISSAIGQRDQYYSDRIRWWVWTTILVILTGAITSGVGLLLRRLGIL